MAPKKSVPVKAPSRITSGEDTPAVADVVEKEEKLKYKEPEAIIEREEGDYLLKYQYGKELPLGDPRSNPNPDGKAGKMKAFLLSQPKVRIMIPVEGGTHPRVPASVTLNGYRLDLPRNTYINVPEQVAEVIMQSQKQTTEALAQFQITKENKDALN